MSAAPPLNWIRQIEASLVSLDEKPQFGLPEPFSWEIFQEELEELLSGKVTVKQMPKGWVASKDAFAGLGGKLLSIAIDWTPLQTPAYFLTDEQNIKTLMASVFDSEEAASYFYESSYVEGFFHYFGAEILRLLEKQQFGAPVTPRLAYPPKNLAEIIGEEACYVIDVSMELEGNNYWGRILLNESFRREWKESYSLRPTPELSDAMKEKITVDLSLEVAHTRLSVAEWKKIKTGDMIVLDRCSYDPNEHSGSVILKLNERPLFRGRLKEGGIKIISYPVYEEADKPMAKDPFNKDFDLDDDEEEEDEEDDLYGDLTEDEDSEFDEDEEDMFAGLEPPKELKAAQPKAEKKQAKVAAQLAPVEEAPVITADELPIDLTIEVGKIRMSAAALMNLNPGNLLELNVAPEQGVDLVINGKKVGRGELIRIGDLLGVRIISL